MSPHIAVEKAQASKFLPEVAGHFVNHGAFHVNNFIVGEWQHEIFGVGVHQRKGEVVMVVAPVNGVHMHVIEHIMHPAHIPLHAESQATDIGRTRN